MSAARRPTSRGLSARAWSSAPSAHRKNSQTLAGYNIGDVARRAPAVIGGHLETALADLASGVLPYRPPSVVTVVDAAGVAEVHRAFEAGKQSGKTVLRLR